MFSIEKRQFIQHYLIRYKSKGSRCESGIAIFARRSLITLSLPLIKAENRINKLIIPPTNQSISETINQ